MQKGGSEFCQNPDERQRRINLNKIVDSYLCAFVFIKSGGQPIPRMSFRVVMRKAVPPAHEKK